MGEALQRPLAVAAGVSGNDSLGPISASPQVRYAVWRAVKAASNLVKL